MTVQDRTPADAARLGAFREEKVANDWLTEVNVTSPTCARELDAQFGLNIAGLLFDAIERGPAPRHAA